MIAHGAMGEFDQLDALARAAHAEALDVLAARIDVKDRLRQLLADLEDPPSGNYEPGNGGT
jgi:hypothetical protein